MSGLAVHGAANHHRSILFRENSRQISGVAHQEQSHLDGDNHVDYSCLIVFHFHFRVGASGRLSRPSPRRVYCAVFKGRDEWEFI